MSKDNTNGENDFLISLKRIKIFKNRALQSDNLNINPNLPTNQRYNRNNNNNKQTSHEPNTISLSSSIKPTPIHIIKDESLRKLYEQMEYLIKKETSHKQTQLPPIEPTIYKRLLKKDISTLLNEHTSSIRVNSYNSSDKNHKQHIPINRGKSSVINRSTISSKQKQLLNPLTQSYSTLLPSSSHNPHKQHYMIFPGNNSSLIERIMSKRNSHWELLSHKDKTNLPHANFIWTELAYEINFINANQYKQIVNHYEHNSEIANKMKLICNIIKYNDIFTFNNKNISNIFTYLPFTIIFPLTNDDIYTHNITSFKSFYNSLPSFISNSTSFYYGDYFHLPYPSLSSSPSLTNYKITLPRSSYANSNLWLIKPINLNRGRCIQIHNSLNDIITALNAIKNKKYFTNEHNDKVIECEYVMVQKCIEDIQLYSNKKYDIRVWILLTTFKENSVFIFKEGHLKICSVNYNVNTINHFVHLTNYSIQKYHNEFGKVAQGNEIAFWKYQDELKKNKVDVDFRKVIWPKICNAVVNAVRCCKYRINVLNRKNCFEIFGCDFIVDKYWDVFLIEINTNPGYEESSPVIKELLPRMIDDAFKICLDTNNTYSHDDNSRNTNESTYFPVKGYANNENLWEEHIL